MNHKEKMYKQMQLYMYMNMIYVPEKNVTYNIYI